MLILILALKNWSLEDYAYAFGAVSTKNLRDVVQKVLVLGGHSSFWIPAFSSLVSGNFSGSNGISPCSKGNTSSIRVHFPARYVSLPEFFFMSLIFLIMKAFRSWRRHPTLEHPSPSTSSNRSPSPSIIQALMMSGSKRAKSMSFKSCLRKKQAGPATCCHSIANW